MKKSIILLLLLVVLCCGCGQKKENSLSDFSKEPTVLVYGYIDAYSFQDFDAEIKKKIVEFNRSQSEYYIEIKQYGEDDYEAGLAAMNAEISAGKGPDIIQIDGNVQYEEYVHKGTIVDLYAFLEKDAELQKEDFFENVLKQLEVDGKLCGMVPFFTIFSAVGNPNLLDDSTVTFDRLYQMMETSEDITVFAPLSKEQVFYYCCFPELEAFVDWENKTCDFTGEEFTRLLEFSNRFDFQNVENGSMYDIYVKMQENKVAMVMGGPIADFDDYSKYKSLFGTDALLIGWPTFHGSGPQIASNSPYLTINSNSKEQEGAWEFLKGFCENQFLLAEDNAKKGFPITRDAFDLRAKKAMEVRMGTDEEGNPVELPDEYEITDRSGKTFRYPVYAATEEQVAYLKAVIENLQVTQDYGEVSFILFEEAMDYWNGSKTATEVVEVIQNRVTNYLNEIS